MPIGALITNKKYLEVFHREPGFGHISTFGGHPFSCFIASRFLTLFTEKKLWERAKTLQQKFEEIIRGYPVKYRASGAMCAVDIKVPANAIIPLILRNLQINVSGFLFNERALRIYPPLNMDVNIYEMLLEKLMNFLQKEGFI